MCERDSKCVYVCVSKFVCVNVVVFGVNLQRPVNACVLV